MVCLHIPHRMVVMATQHSDSRPSVCQSPLTHFFFSNSIPVNAQVPCAYTLYVFLKLQSVLLFVFLSHLFIFLFFESDWMVSVLPEDNKKIADDKTVPNHTKDYRERERWQKSGRNETETRDKQTEIEIESNERKKQQGRKRVSEKGEKKRARERSWMFWSSVCCSVSLWNDCGISLWGAFWSQPARNAQQISAKLCLHTIELGHMKCIIHT